MQIALIVVWAVVAIIIAVLVLALSRRNQENRDLLKTVSALQKSTEILQAIAFGESGDKKSVLSLIRALDDRDPRIHNAAANVLSGFRSNAVAPVASAIAHKQTSTVRGCNVLHSCVQSEGDVLAALDHSKHDATVCATFLDHPLTNPAVLKSIAEHGPPDTLSKLVSMDAVQGSTTQTIAQQRLAVEAERRAAETSSYGADDDSFTEHETEYETGTCDCRYR